MDIRTKTMSRLVLHRIAMLPTCWLAVLSIVLFASALSAQTNSIAKHAGDGIEASAGYRDSVLREGAQLESKGHWGEALALYQKAIRKQPSDEALVTRRAVARIHYDLNRRYSDSSFIQTIVDTDAKTSMNVYAEVLLKIQSYYVDEPNWADLASYGLTSLEVALMSPEFRKVNLRGISDSEVRETILATRKRLESASVTSRHDAYLVASDTAQHLQNTIGLNAQSTMYEFVCGAISALDSYSAFMSSNQYSETMSQIEGNFVGLGVELRTHDDHLEIVSVIPGSSAGKGGIVKGDKILAVDEQYVTKVGSERAADLMRGVEGSYVSVVLDRGNGPRKIELQRRRVEIPSVDQVGIIDSENGVGYIRLTNFQKTTARDFDAALWDLHRKGMRSLIVDVRGNPGGLLPASVEVADRFVSDGIIVSTKGRNPMEDLTYRANVANTWRVPLVVMVDENSASASEIFAAAIRDHKRGTIVGNDSYGKGSVQGIFQLNVSGGGVRLTTSKFFSPNGSPINQIGVKADVLVHQTAKVSFENLPLEEDTALRTGIVEARKKLGQVIDISNNKARLENQQRVAGY